METAQSIRSQIAGIPVHEANEILLSYIDWYLPKECHDWFFEGLGLPPQRVQILTCLAKNKGRTVSKDNLAAYCGRDALHDGCNVQIHYIRKALKAANWPVEIATVWGVGYSLKTTVDFRFPWEPSA